MTIQRFTLSEPEGATDDISFTFPVETGISVQSVAPLTRQESWRTEAMRSYDHPVLIWFTRGQGRLAIAGRTCGYGPHNLVFLPAGTMHGFTTSGAVLGSVVHLPDAMMWPEIMHLRLTDVQMQRELTSLVEAIATEASRDSNETPEALRCHAGLLSIWLARALTKLGCETGGSNKTTAAHRLAESYASLVERDFRKPIGVQHYASLLGVTPTHLSRACRRASGRPALEILLDRRCFEARRLLRETKLRVANIAEKSGFASAAYFTRSFRSLTGESPSEFRQRR